MPSKIFNLAPLLNKIFLKERCAYLRNNHLKRYYNVLFFGSEAIALNSLQKVNQFRKNGNIVKRLDLVTANSSKNKTLIEKYAYAGNIRILQWPHLDINDGEYDIGLVVAFGHLIKKDVLRKFPLSVIRTKFVQASTHCMKIYLHCDISMDVLYVQNMQTYRGMINVHPSLLPRWRGAAPIIYTLLHGDEVGGVSLMKIKPDVFDVGEIISQRRVPIPKDIKLPELTNQLSDIGAEMLIDCLRCLPSSIENSWPQSNEGVTYAKKINKCISEVSWTEKSAKEVYNLYRALYGLYPLSTKFRDKPMKLFDAFLVEADPEFNDKSVGTLEYCENTQAIRILCKDKRFIYFKSLRIVGKREISALDFYNGYIKNMLDKRKYVINII